MRGNKSLSDIYQRCNMDVLEPADHEEALNHLKWKKYDDEEELYMIEKNNTIVDIPTDRKVIVVYGGSINKNKFVGYYDIDWGGSLEDMNNTSGYCFSLGSRIFSWSSKKQEIVTQSTAEARLIVVTIAVNQTLWIRKILADLKFNQKAMLIIKRPISNNPVFHMKTKYLKIKYYFLKEVQRRKEVVLVHCKTEDQLADILTKALPKGRFEDLRQKIGVCRSKIKEECWKFAFETAH